MDAQNKMFLRFHFDEDPPSVRRKATSFLLNHFPFSEPNVLPKQNFPTIAQTETDGLSLGGYFEDEQARREIARECASLRNHYGQRKRLGCTGHHNMRKNESC